MAWFPITDLAREDDIRMRRRRALMLLSCIVFVPWIAFGDHASPSRPITRTASLSHPSEAAPRREIAAPSLTLDLRCAASVTVLADPAFAGRAVIYAGEEDRAVLDTLTLAQGSIAQQGDCRNDADLIVRTGTTTPLTLVQSGGNDIHAGSFDAPVTIESAGSGDVTIDRAGPLTVRSRASGDVSVNTVNAAITVLLQGSGDFTAGAITGTVQATTDGSGDVTIDTAHLDRLTLRAQGSGDVVVRHGHIATLDAVRHGSGDLTIDAAIDAGTLDHRGDGDVDVPHAAGLIRTGD